MTPIVPADPKPSDFPMKFGRYTLLERLGKGASGQVFLAELQGAAGFRKRVALKIMRQQFEGDKANFIREGRLCGLLNHRNVMDTYEFGVHANQAFISMEFIDGVTLSTLCQFGPLPPSVVLEVGLHICRGLAYAHRLHGVDGPFGLVHRDIKPSNILIGSDGSVKVADFGIAVLTAADIPHTPEDWLGSPGYMSPEQWNKQPLDASSDVFSLCVILYQMCTAQRLIEGDGIDSRRQAALSIEQLIQNPDTLLPIGKHIAGLDQVIAQGLRLNPEERFADAEALGTQLRQLQQHAAREPSLEDWLASTLDKQEQNWGDLRPPGTPTKPDSIAPPPTLEAPGRDGHNHAIKAAITQLRQSSTLEDVLGTLRIVERAIADLPTHQQEGHLESLHDALTQAGLQRVRQGEFPHLIADRKTGKYWYQGEECIQLRPGALSERFLFAVATRGPDLSRIALYEQIWEQPYLPPSSDTVLRVRAHKVRADLAPLGLSIERYEEGQYIVSGMPAVLSWQPETASDKGVVEGWVEPPAHRSTNIESPPNAFFGRTREMAELTRLYTQQQAVVTVLGPPGTGKTRMVQEWARTQLEAGAVQSAWFCDLSPSSTTLGILGVVAQSLGVQLTGAEQAEEKLIERLGYAISGRGQTLVILDNAEQVSTAVHDILKQWGSIASDARFVVTSRVPLGLKMEQRLRLEPLALPGDIGSSTRLTANDAMDLFVERAQAVEPEFSIDDHNAALVAAVVTQLDGLPLAIELAAARSCVLSPRQLLDRLSERFKLLKGGKSPRQETLEGAIQWSWDLLEPWEQAAMAQLSVFQDGFLMEAAEAVLDLSVWPEAPWWLDVVESLLDKSLIYSRKVLDAPRFGMYMSIQEFAAKRLAGDPSLNEHDDAVMSARLRHARHFAKLGTREHFNSLSMHGGVNRRWRLSREVENLFAGAKAALDYGVGEVAAHCALAAVWDNTALGMADNLLARVMGKVEPRGITWARMVRKRADIKRHLGQSIEALELFEQALSVYREQGDHSQEGFVLQALANLQGSLGHIDEALENFQQALLIHRRMGDRCREGSTLGNLASLLCITGKSEKAMEHYQQALAIAIEVGNLRSEGITSANIGTVLNDRGQLSEASEHYEKSLSIYRELGDRQMESGALANLGLVYFELGRHQKALDYMKEALALAREVGDRQMEGIILGNIGDALFAQGETKGIEEYFEQAIAIGDENNLIAAAAFRGSLALLRAQEGDLHGARSLLITGEEQLRGVHRVELGKLLCRKAQVDLLSSDPDAANKALAQAESIASTEGVGSSGELSKMIDYAREALGAKVLSDD